MSGFPVIKHRFCLLALLLAAQFVATEAFALPQIFNFATANGFNVTTCQSCHNTSPGSEARDNLKPGYLAAYELDTMELSRLKNIVNGCSNGQTLNTTTYLCETATPQPVVCVPPKVRDPATNTCITPSCPAGQVLNSSGACVTPPPPPVTCTPPKVRDPATNICVTPVTPPQASCLPPKQLINGACILPGPMACTYTKNVRGDRLRVTDPGKIYVHAGQMLKVGVIALGDKRKTTMGITGMPAQGAFQEFYNNILYAQQAVLTWHVPDSVSEKALKVSFCAKASGGGADDVYSPVRDVRIEILPKLANTLIPDPTVSSIVVASAVYNATQQQFEVSGAVYWAEKSSDAERKAAILQPLTLTDADQGVTLGTVKVNLDGSWNTAIKTPRANVSRAIDAVFLGHTSLSSVRKIAKTAKIFVYK